MTSSSERDDLLPPSPDARGRGLAIALGMHAALIGALALGVNWKSSAPDAVEAELWAAVPQAAAPPPAPTPAPPPPPPAPAPAAAPAPDRHAELAIEKQRKQAEAKRQRELQEAKRKKREEAQRREAERKKQEEAERLKRELAEKQRLEQQRKAEAEKRRLAEEKRLAELREAQMQRIISQAGGTGTQATGAPQGGAAGTPSAGYAGRLRARIKPNIIFVDTLTTNPAAEVEVRAAPDGTILGARLVKSSGHPEWDQAVLRAIERTETLPRDDNGRVPSPILITFRPKD